MKHCIHCGKEVPDGVFFCVFCGKRLPEKEEILTEDQAQETQPTSKGSSKKVIVILLCVIIALLVAIAVLLLYNQRSAHSKGTTEKDTQTEESSDIPNENSDETVPDNEDTGNFYDSSDEFEIGLDSEEDYGNALDYNNYAYYVDEDYSDFNFSYPTNLYCSVETDISSSSYHSATHKKSISFTGDKGSILTYQYYTIDSDSMTMKELVAARLSDLKGELVSTQVYVNYTHHDSGKLVVTGKNDVGHPVYDLTYFDDHSIKVMRVEYPDYTSKTDKHEKSYVTECLYYLCGFSHDNGGCRSYSSYLNSL